MLLSSGTVLPVPALRPTGLSNANRHIRVIALYQIIMTIHGLSWTMPPENWPCNWDGLVSLGLGPTGEVNCIVPRVRFTALAPWPLHNDRSHKPLAC